jgi:RNA polymerase sigma factor (sigma-70 family)
MEGTMNESKQRMDAEQLITDNTRLVYSLAHGFRNRNLFDDLVGVGMLALVRASQSYNSDDGTAFSTYATRCIRNAMFDMLRRGRSQRKRLDALEQMSNSNQYEMPQHNHEDAVDVLRRVLERTNLDERTIAIIHHRYGIGTERLTLEQTSERVKLSPARVQQIESKALRLLREQMQSEFE